MIRFAIRFAAALLGCLPLATLAFPIGPQPPSPTVVVEYYNTDLGHYFYTATPEEIAALDAGGGGPGWVRTGQGFAAFATLEASTFQGFKCDTSFQPCKPVTRFYAPGPNSHFYTGRTHEVEGLKDPRSGWIFERVAFWVPLPVDGRCFGGQMPVYRLYNDRAPFNDTNHRYTASQATRVHMLGRGWLDEGIAYCSYSAVANPGDAFSFAISQPASLQPAAQCLAGEDASCVAFENLPVPSVVYRPPVDYTADAFDRKIGWNSSENYIQDIGLFADLATAASNTFVQIGVSDTSAAGVYMTTANRLSPARSRVSLVRKLTAAAPGAGAADARFFPFRIPYGTPQLLRLYFFVAPNLFSAEPGGGVGGGGWLEFMDTRSGGRFRIEVTTYGNSLDAGGPPRDPVSGVPVLRSVLGRDSVYGAFTGWFVSQATPFTADRGVEYTWSMSALNLRNAIAAAQETAPGLSGDPADYIVANFAQYNEVVGHGEIGMHEVGPKLFRLPE